MTTFWPFKKKPRARLTIPEPTLEERIALYREAALLDGYMCLSAYANVAPGSPGYGALQLVHEGLMTRREERGVFPADAVSHYSLTPRGFEARNAALRPLPAPPSPSGGDLMDGNGS